MPGYTARRTCRKPANRRSKAYRTRWQRMAANNWNTYDRFRESDYSYRQKDLKIKVERVMAHDIKPYAMSTPVPWFVNRSWSLNDIAAQRPEIASGWDMYRIRAVKVKILNGNLPPVSNGSANGIRPEYYVYKDYDGGWSTDMEGVRARNLAVGIDPWKDHEFLVEPCCQMWTNATSGQGSNTTVVKSPWLDVAVADTAHFGFGLACLPDSSTTAHNVRVTIQETYYIELRNSR